MADDFSFVKNSGGLKNGVSNHVIRVLGIGGCGNKAVNHMIKEGLDGPEYIALNSDPQDLDNCLATTKLLIGEKATKRGGCGGDPILGQKACEESLERRLEILEGTDMLFITAGMGGGTGSGGAPVVAQALSEGEEPPLIVGIVATPFGYERQRMRISEEVVKDLTSHCNCIITVSNAKLQETAPKQTTVEQAQAMANDILYKAVAGIIEILTKPGSFNNLDYRDIRSVMGVKGPGLIGLGESAGEDRAKKAFKNAIASPLMGNASIKGAKRILVNITGDDSVLFEEFNEINMMAADEADPDAQIFAGMVTDNSLKSEGTLRVTVIATGLGHEEEWAAPAKDDLDGLAEEIINLDTIVDEPMVVVRAENEPPQVAPLAARPPLEVKTAPPAPAARHQAAAARSLAGPGAIPRKPTKYEPNVGAEQNQQAPKFYAGEIGGVDPVNNNPKKFEKPSFMRKGQS
jgi:cell division protein FtsZ